MKKILLLLIASTIAIAAQAQNVNLVTEGQMTPEEKQEISLRVKQKVNDFQRYIQDLAMPKSMSHNYKMQLKEITLDLFIGKGDQYSMEIPTSYGSRTEVYPAVTMGIFKTKYNKKLRVRQLMKEYLQSLISRSENPRYRYKKIVMEAADAVRVDSYSKVGPGRYKAVAHILQHFAGYNAEGWKVYEDYTSKRIEIFINRVEIEVSENQMETYWEILLGNIDCDDVW